MIEVAIEIARASQWLNNDVSTVTDGQRSTAGQSRVVAGRSDIGIRESACLASSAIRVGGAGGALYAKERCHAFVANTVGVVGSTLTGWGWLSDRNVGIDVGKLTTRIFFTESEIARRATFNIDGNTSGDTAGIDAVIKDQFSTFRAFHESDVGTNDGFAGTRNETISRFTSAVVGACRTTSHIEYALFALLAVSVADTDGFAWASILVNRIVIVTSADRTTITVLLIVLTDQIGTNLVEVRTVIVIIHKLTAAYGCDCTDDK